VLAEHSENGWRRPEPASHESAYIIFRNGEALNCPIELGMAGVVGVTWRTESMAIKQMMGWDKRSPEDGPCQHAGTQPRTGRDSLTRVVIDEAITEFQTANQRNRHNVRIVQGGSSAIPF